MLKDIVPQKCGIVNVSWDPPPDESESRPVASYEAEVGLDNYTWNNCIKTSEKPSCQFRGLLKARKYPVRVRALNPQGPSNWSKGFISLNASGTLKYNSNMEKKACLIITSKMILLTLYGSLICHVVIEFHLTG